MKTKTLDCLGHINKIKKNSCDAQTGLLEGQEINQTFNNSTSHIYFIALCHNLQVFKRIKKWLNMKDGRLSFMIMFPTSVDELTSEIWFLLHNWILLLNCIYLFLSIAIFFYDTMFTGCVEGGSKFIHLFLKLVWDQNVHRRRKQLLFGSCIVLMNQYSSRAEWILSLRMKITALVCPEPPPVGAGGHWQRRVLHSGTWWWMLENPSSGPPPGTCLPQCGASVSPWTTTSSADNSVKPQMQHVPYSISGCLKALNNSSTLHSASTLLLFYFLMDVNDN